MHCGNRYSEWKDPSWWDNYGHIIIIVAVVCSPALAWLLVGLTVPIWYPFYYLYRVHKRHAQNPADLAQYRSKYINMICSDSVPITSENRALRFAIQKLGGAVVGDPFVDSDHDGAVMVAIRNGTPHDLSDVYEADQTAWIKCCCGFRWPKLAEGEVSMQLSLETGVPAFVFDGIPFDAGNGVSVVRQTSDV